MRHASIGLRTVHGALGGLVAGAVVALWFFVVDVVSAEAFRTPSVLAAEILGEASAVPQARLVFAYTVLHFGVFAALGAVTGAVLAATSVSPGLLVGGVFGIGVLNGVHYGGLVVTDVDLLTVLPVTHVLGANLVGGMAMMAYLHRAWHVDAPLGWRIFADRPLLLEGFATGLLGALAVALWFFLVDVASGAPLFTPAALGSALFFGAGNPADVEHTAGVALAYTMVHVLAFLAVGVAFAWVAAQLEREPTFWLLPILAFIVLEGLFLGIVGMRASWVLGALGWWAILGGNLAAVTAMGWWTWNSHPRLREAVGSQVLETRV